MLPLHRQGWKWPSHPSHLLTLCLMLIGSMTVRSYEDEKCYCVSEENETIRQAIADFTDTPSVSKYEYIGARYNSTADGFDPCVCDDVVCVLSELTVTEQYVLELATKNETELNDNVTKALDATAKAAFKSNVALTHIYLSSFATYKETNDSKVIFNVEFIVKGTDTIIKDKASQ
ncbi:uncharacterized protein LOC135089783 [Scylla paramamosain]|uniref:uncharacterized protein LOC135089783 n=1 Tax=Scylla paramamosain TaxID=85552 RepID=UPI003083A610